MVRDVTFNEDGSLGITPKFFGKAIMIKSVDEGSLAAQKGIVSGEYIIKINGDDIINGYDEDALFKMVEKRPVTLLLGTFQEAVANAPGRTNTADAPIKEDSPIFKAAALDSGEKPVKEVSGGGKKRKSKKRKQRKTKRKQRKTKRKQRKTKRKQRKSKKRSH